MNIGDINLNYHIHESSLKCPYCDETCVDDDHCVGEDGFDVKTEYQCEHCDKTFHAEANIVYSTYSDCSLNGIDHEWYSIKSHPTVFHCKNCSQYDVRTPKEAL